MIEWIALLSVAASACIIVASIAFGRYFALLEARNQASIMNTPAAVERERQKGLTNQVDLIRRSEMFSKDKEKAIRALVGLHEPDADELAMRAAAREVSRGS